MPVAAPEAEDAAPLPLAPPAPLAVAGLPPVAGPTAPVPVPPSPPPFVASASVEPQETEQSDTERSHRPKQAIPETLVLCDMAVSLGRSDPRVTPEECRTGS